jgi:ribosomal protein S1
VVSAVVKRITEDKNVIVSISGNVTGVIKNAHLADGKIGKPELRFKEGKTIRCRVLVAKRGRIYLTAKKTLVNSLLPPLTSLATAHVGQKAHGVVTNITDHLVFVEFYDKVVGVVHKKDVVANDAESTIRLHAPLAVKVRTINAAKQRMTLTLSLRDDDEEKRNEIMEQFSVGNIVSGTILEKRKGGFQVSISSGAVAYLPFSHLSDHLAHTEKLSALYKPGDVIKALAIIKMDSTENSIKITVTAKPSLIIDCQEHSLPQTNDELRPGTLLVGYVSRVGATGVSVSFLGDAYVWVPKAFVSDRFVTSPSDFCTVGQSVRVCIHEAPRVNEEGKNIMVIHGSLKMSECFTTHYDFLSTFIEEEEKIAATATAMDTEETAAAIQWEEYVPGTLATVVVTQVKDYGVLSAFADERLSGFTIADHVPGGRGRGGEEGVISVGEKRTAIILDVDKGKKIIDVSFKPELIAFAVEQKQKPKVINLNIHLCQFQL